jgi:hypothetical protein
MALGFIELYPYYGGREAKAVIKNGVVILESIFSLVDIFFD